MMIINVCSTMLNRIHLKQKIICLISCLPCKYQYLYDVSYANEVINHIFQNKKKLCHSQWHALTLHLWKKSLKMKSPSLLSHHVADSTSPKYITKRKSQIYSFWILWHAHMLHLSGFYEERAILLGRLGRHEQALGIYVHVLSDVHLAEE